MLVPRGHGQQAGLWLTPRVASAAANHRCPRGRPCGAMHPRPLVGVRRGSRRRLWRVAACSDIHARGVTSAWSSHLTTVLSRAPNVWHSVKKLDVCFRPPPFYRAARLNRRYLAFSQRRWMSSFGPASCPLPPTVGPADPRLAGGNAELHGGVDGQLHADRCNRWVPDWSGTPIPFPARTLRCLAIATRVWLSLIFQVSRGGWTMPLERRRRFLDGPLALAEGHGTL